MDYEVFYTENIVLCRSSISSQ